MSCVHTDPNRSSAVLQVEGGTVRKNGDGYVFEPRDEPSAGRCYDVTTDSEGVRQAFDSIERNTNSYVLPYRYSGRPFSVTLKLDPSFRIHEGSYFVTEDGDVGISSSAFYVKDGKQTFLNCPTGEIEWRVFKVLDIEFH